MSSFRLSIAAYSCPSVIRRQTKHLVALLNNLQILAFVAVVIGSAHASANARVVVISGDSAPGIPGGLSFAGPFVGSAPPSISEQGYVTFQGALYFTPDIVNESNDTGIWSESSGSLDLVVRENDIAPGTNGRERFGSPSLYTPFDDAVPLTSSGQGAVYGTTLPGGYDRGIWSDRSGQLEAVVLEGNPAPGTTAELFEVIGYPAFSLTGKTAFHATLLEEFYCCETSGTGIWSERSGVLEMVVRDGTLAPGLSPLRFDEFSERLATNSSGETVFNAALKASHPQSPVQVTSRDDDSLWTDRGGYLTLVTREGAVAPGVNENLLFKGPFIDPKIDDAGHISFVASLVDANGYGAGSGVWSNHNGLFSPLLLSGDQAPGFDDGVWIGGLTSTRCDNIQDCSTVSQVVLNEDGDFALAGKAFGPESTWWTDAVWAHRDGELTLVAREGDQAPGLPEGTIFSNTILGNPTFEIPAINSDGQIAFQAQFTRPNHISGMGIWATDPAGTLRLIAAMGETIDVAPGPEQDLRQLGIVSFAGGSNGRDGRPSGFNDRGEVAYAAELFGTGTGVFVGLSADFDFDMDFDGHDFLAWQRTDGTAAGLKRWKDNYGTLQPAVAVTPEPASGVLLMMASLLSAVRSCRLTLRCCVIRKKASECSFRL